MTEYTPLKTPRTPTKLVKPKSVDDKFREEIILTAAMSWIKHDIETARDFAIEQKQRKAAQRQKHGGYTKGGKKAGMYLKYVIPQELMDNIRVCLRWAEIQYGVEFEVFGLDDKDMKLLVENFPDLFGEAHNMKWGKKCRQPT
jgi:hypothetical protein